MALQWKKAYSVGNAIIDAEHQELFSKANAFLAATDKASLTSCAMSFFKYTREHFQHEESLMREVAYPALDAHVKQHNALVGRLNDIAASIANSDLNRKDLESFLSDWLLGHIRVFDTKLAAYLGGAQTGREHAGTVDYRTTGASDPVR